MENKINIDKLKALGAIDCPADKKQLFQPAVDQLCSMSGWSQEHPVLVIDSEETYICYGSGKESNPTVDIPDCVPFHCAHIDHQAYRICKENAWPCGHRVLIYHNDKFCWCVCC